MTTPRFVQVHTLHSWPAALLNRDDAGLAKRLPFGGATRTRISSQCLKRHWRMATDEFALATIGVEMGKRSRMIFTRGIVEELTKEGFDRGAVREIVAALKDRLFPSDKENGSGSERETRKDPLETEQAFMLGLPEIDYLRALVRRVLLGDSELKAAMFEKPKKKDQLTDFQKQQKKNLNDNLDLLRESARLPRGLESALFGRMVTSDLVANTDAAIHVAHAFTVHAEESESDYFTVVDDLKKRAKGDDAGSAGIFDMELTSGLYYGYVVVDVPLLVSNLEGSPSEEWLDLDRDLAAKVVEHLLHLIATVSPGAKLGATAPYGWAQLMLLELGSRQPRSLANAYRDPVRLRAEGGTFAEASEKFADHLEKLDAAYGGREVRRYLSVDDLGRAPPLAARGSLDAIASWAGDAVRAGAC